MSCSPCTQWHCCCWPAQVSVVHLLQHGSADLECLLLLPSRLALLSLAVKLCAYSNCCRLSQVGSRKATDFAHVIAECCCTSQQVPPCADTKISSLSSQQRQLKSMLDCAQLHSCCFDSCLQRFWGGGTSRTCLPSASSLGRAPHLCCQHCRQQYRQMRSRAFRFRR